MSIESSGFNKLAPTSQIISAEAKSSNISAREQRYRLLLEQRLTSAINELMKLLLQSNAVGQPSEEDNGNNVTPGSDVGAAPGLNAREELAESQDVPHSDTQLRAYRRNTSPNNYNAPISLFPLPLAADMEMGAAKSPVHVSKPTPGGAADLRTLEEQIDLVSELANALKSSS